jgi:hypothetical protein
LSDDDDQRGHHRDTEDTEQRQKREILLIDGCRTMTVRGVTIETRKDIAIQRLAKSVFPLFEPLPEPDFMKNYL